MSNQKIQTQQTHIHHIQSKRELQTQHAQIYHISSKINHRPLIAALTELLLRDAVTCLSVCTHIRNVHTEVCCLRVC